MSAILTTTDRPLVLGLGNVLLGDDAAGPLAVQALARLPGADRMRLRDGGTIGLALLPEIEAASAFIAVDAAQLDAAPGTVQVFEGLVMDEQLGGRKQSAHELALADLMGAAALGGRLPPRRALVAVEPADTALGLEPTPAVAAALPALVAAVEALVARWAPGRTNASDAALPLQEVAHEA
jgi:hydrogenase maturation protease